MGADQWPSIRTGHLSQVAGDREQEELPLGARVSTFLGLAVVLGVSLVAPIIAGQTRANYLVTHESLPDQVSAHLLKLQARPNQTAPEGLDKALREVTALRAHVAVPLFCAAAVWLVLATTAGCSRTLIRGRTREA